MELWELEERLRNRLDDIYSVLVEIRDLLSKPAEAPSSETKPLVRAESKSQQCRFEIQGIPHLPYESETGSEPPTWEDLRGAAPDATGGQSSEKFVRKLRDEWPDHG